MRGIDARMVMFSHVSCRDEEEKQQNIILEQQLLLSLNVLFDRSFKPQQTIWLGFRDSYFHPEHPLLFHFFLLSR